MRAKLLNFIMPLILLCMVINIGSAQDAPSEVKFSFSNNADEERIFMQLRRSLETRVNDEDSRRAKFGMAEYYFKHNALLDAFRAFKEYADNYPPETSTLLARIYLYKIANMKNDADVAADLKKQILGNSFILLFSKFKILKYQSPFNNNYEINYYLDKIKVFLNGGDFEEINP